MDDGTVIFPNFDAWLGHWFNQACSRIRAAKPNLDPDAYQVALNWIRAARHSMVSGDGTEFAWKLFNLGRHLKEFAQ